MAKEFKFGFVITGDSASGTKALRKTKTEVDNLGKSTDQARKRTDTYRGSIVAQNQALGRAKTLIAGFAGAAALGGIGAILFSVTQNTKEFGTSISNLSAITGATGEDLAFLSDQARDIGRTTTLSATEAVTAFKLIASAKPDLLESGEALNSVTRSAVTLAEAAGIDLPAAAQALGGSLNQFGADAEEANRFINVLAAGSQLGASAIDQTTEALNKSGAAANALGLSFEETNAAIQVLAKGAIVGSEAGIGLRNVLLALEQESDEGLKPSIVGVAAAIENLRAKGLDTVEMMDLFGKQNLVAGQTLVDNAALLGELEKGLTGTSTAIEQARTNTDNWEGDLKSQASAFEGLTLVLGERMIPALREFTQENTAALNSVTAWIDDDGVEDVILVAEALGVVIAARLIPALAGSAASMALFQAQALLYGGSARAAALGTKALTGSITLLRGALALIGGPIGLLIIAVGGLALAYKELKETQANALTGAALNSARQGLEVVNLHILGVTNRIADLNIEHRELQNQTFHSLREMRRMREITEELSDAADELNPLMKARNRLLEEQRERTRLAADGMENFVGPLQAVTGEIEAQTEATEALAEAQVKAREKIDEFIASLESDIIAINLTGLELALYNATADKMTDATGEQLVAIVELTTGLYNEKTALEATAQAAKDKEKADSEAAREAERNLKEVTRANERAAKAMAEDWRDTRDAFADFFVDFSNDGENAFDALADSFEASLKRMVAQWLASGIMNFFNLSGGGTGGSFFNFGGSGGGAGGSSFISSAAGGAGSAFLGSLAFEATQAGSLLGSLGSGVVGVNSMVSPALAAEGLFGGLGSSVTALASNPLTWGAAAILVAAGNDFWKDPDGYVRTNSGLLVAPTPGADPSRLFDIDPFASGFQGQGFNRRGSIADANSVIDQFRAIDQLITGSVGLAGGNIDLSNATLAGVNEDGIFGTSGTFLGVGGKTQQFDAQLDFFANQLADHITGLSAETLADLQGANGVVEIIGILEALIGTNEEAKRISDAAAEKAGKAAQDILDAANREAERASRFLRETALEDVIDIEAGLVADRDAAERELELLRGLGIDGLEVRELALIQAREDAELRLQLIRESGLLRLAQLQAGLTAPTTTLTTTTASNQSFGKADGIFTARDSQAFLLRNQRAIDLGFGDVSGPNKNAILDSVFSLADSPSADGLLDFQTLFPNVFASHTGAFQKGIESASGSLTASELRNLNDTFNNLLTAMESVVVSSNKTADALDEAVRNGDGSLAVVVAA